MTREEWAQIRKTKWLLRDLAEVYGIELVFSGGPMNNWQKQVDDFHKKYGATRGESPGFRDQELRLDLIWEEVQELIEAVEEDDFIEAVDALTDIIYVVLGAAVSWGVNLEPIFREVHDTNMKKDGGGTTENGKIRKPEGWRPPNILGLLQAQGYASDSSRAN